MGKQLTMFQSPDPTSDDRLNAAQAEMRRERMARDATRPSPRHRPARVSRGGSRCTVTCPSCGSTVALAVVT